MGTCNPHPHNPFAERVCASSPFGVTMAATLTLIVLAMAATYVWFMLREHRSPAPVTTRPAARSRVARRTLTTVASLVVAAGVFVTVLAASTASAHAATGPELRPATGVHVEETEPAGRRGLAVVFSNGARQVLRPCAFEDSAGCWWDAGRQGNHRGHSFVAVLRAGRVCLAFLDDRYAAHHDRCGEDSYADHDGAGE